MTKHHVLLSLSLLCLATSPRAAANDPLPANIDGKSWFDASLRLGLPQVEDADVFVVASRISALIPVGDSGAIALQGGFAFADLDGESRAVISNFLIGYAFRASPELRFTPGLVLPLASISNDDLDEALGQVLTHAFAVSAYGLHEFWMHFPEAFSIVLPLRADYQLSDSVRMEIDAAAAFSFPSEGDDDLELFIDTEAAVLFSVVRIGLGVVLVPTIEGDKARLSASLGVRVPVGQGRIHADLKLDLDEPAFFDNGAVPAFAIGYTTPL